MTEAEKETILRARGAGSTGVQRRGNVVLRPAAPWTPTVHSLLRHLERRRILRRSAGRGFGICSRRSGDAHLYRGRVYAPRPVVHRGRGRGGTSAPEPTRGDGNIQPPPDAVWPPWFGRRLGGPNRIIGHCDVAPWNIVTRDGLPVALIDWETAGPVDPMIELAQTCWLNAKLFDDDVAEREGLPSLEVRACQLRAIVDAYGPTMSQRRRIVDLIIGYAIHDAAETADEFKVTPDMVEPMPDGFPIIWGLTWRVRAAAWVYRNRGALEKAIT